MSADLFTSAPALPANRLAEHQVRTLPALIYALQHLAKTAQDAKASGINVADIDPLHGATVSLNRDPRGVFFVQFEGLKR